MVNELPTITLKAIGIVRNGITQRPKQGWKEVVSDIVINSSLTEALDGTPVIDIKPYIPEFDSTADARVPQWATYR